MFASQDVESRIQLHTQAWLSPVACCQISGTCFINVQWRLQLLGHIPHIVVIRAPDCLLSS